MYDSKQPENSDPDPNKTIPDLQHCLPASYPVLVLLVLVGASVPCVCLRTGGEYSAHSATGNSVGPASPSNTWPELI